MHFFLRLQHVTIKLWDHYIVYDLHHMIFIIFIYYYQHFYNKHTGVMYSDGSPFKPMVAQEERDFKLI